MRATTAVLATLIATVLVGCADESFDASACEQAPRHVTDTLTSSLDAQGDQSQFRLQKGRAVEGDDGWFVAAQVRVPGIDGDVGVWEVNSLDEAQMTQVRSANATAESVSPFPRVRPDDEAVRHAEWCAEESR